jgi:hypothetical protein
MPSLAPLLKTIMHVPTNSALVLAMPESSIDVTHWWRNKNLRALSLLLFFRALLSIFTQGGE